jgi:hypothetical protein
MLVFATCWISDIQLCNRQSIAVPCPGRPPDRDPELTVFSSSGGVLIRLVKRPRFEHIGEASSDDDNNSTENIRVNASHLKNKSSDRREEVKG